MVFLFVSLACFALSAAVFAATFGIDHFAAAWESEEAASKRGRFSAWAAGSRTLTEIKGWSGIASAASCIAFLCAVFYSLTFVGVGGERRFAVYVTGGPNAANATPRQFYANQADLNRMPMFQYVDSHRIVAGKVSSVMPIGGGLSHVCVANGDYCGLADSSLGLKVGDTAYIRIGRPPTNQRRAPGWLITANEANSLQSDAKFTIENR
jgi:hypothetical protein